MIDTYKDAVEREFAEPKWVEVKDFLEKRLQKLREKNDSPHTIEDTAKLRGQIEEVKFLLEMPKNTRKTLGKTVRYDY